MMSPFFEGCLYVEQLLISNVVEEAVEITGSIFENPEFPIAFVKNR